MNVSTWSSRLLPELPVRDPFDKFFDNLLGVSYLVEVLRRQQKNIYLEALKILDLVFVGWALTIDTQEFFSAFLVSIFSLRLLTLNWIQHPSPQPFYTKRSTLQTGWTSEWSYARDNVIFDALKIKITRNELKVSGSVAITRLSTFEIRVLESRLASFQCNNYKNNALKIKLIVAYLNRPVHSASTGSNCIIFFIIELIFGLRRF